jgi:hypothetical protein
LVPKKRVSFAAIKFPAVFRKQNVVGADAAWDEYADGTGLIYEVYMTYTPYRETQPGDLNRIKYGPSADAVRKYASK